MDESILDTIKTMLSGSVTDDDAPFDTELTVHINSAIMVLRQAGVGPQNGYSITGSDETWSEYLGEKESILDLVKTYIYLSVKTIFDPPSNGSVLQAYNNLMSEYIWRLREQSDPANIFEVDDNA